jgi:hypothetical protein
VKADAFAGDAVDVRRLVAHHAAVVVADVPGADVVTPDDEDVGFFDARLDFAKLTIRCEFGTALL